MNSRILLLILLIGAALAIEFEKTDNESSTIMASTAKPEYIVVLGREDKHTIVRYDINSEIFKKDYNEVKSAPPNHGSWTLNFKSFIKPENLPGLCKEQYDKKKFYSNIATDILGTC